MVRSHPETQICVSAISKGMTKNKKNSKDKLPGANKQQKKRKT